MRDMLFTLDREAKKSLQAQIREFLVTAILEGHLKAREKMPSTRRMSEQLGVSRNTVVLVYQGLTDDGYLLANERSGYFVAETMLEPLPIMRDREIIKGNNEVDWQRWILKNPTTQTNIEKPLDWQSCEFPFVYGQSDPSLFPISDWRDCAYKVVGKKWVDAWSADTPDNDDDMLVDQIRTRILPRRGILVDEDQILVTMGAQMGLYLIASLLVDSSSRLAIEDPGYSDVRNIFRLRTQNIIPIAVDELGLPVDKRIRSADIIYTTPSHQFPTTVTMPFQRRKELLASASKNNALIIEDDYELETNYRGKHIPALKSLDRDGRVIYVGSFSKTLFPGLRLGFMVASKELISEARALRRLMMRHPPANNQRITAFFLSLGYYDVHLRRLHRVYRQRWEAMYEAFDNEPSMLTNVPGFGGTSFWVKGPDDLDAELLAKKAFEQGIIIEPGRVYYAEEPRPKNYFRLGFSSISSERIGPGINKLCGIMRELK